MTLAIRNVLVGAGVFFLFSEVLEKILNFYLLKANPATATWFYAHSIGSALYASLAAEVFEEVGRYLGMRFLVRRADNLGPAVAYGIGHGGLEAIPIGSLGMAQTFIYASMLNSGQLDATLGPVLSADALPHLRTDLEHLSLAMVAIGSLERLIALLIQIGLSLVVWRAVENKQLGLLALAILLHAAVDFPAALFQAGRISAPVVLRMLVIAGVALGAWFLHKLPSKRSASPALPA
jgi:uncharacterized membrane protein YhfC